MIYKMFKHQERLSISVKNLSDESIENISLFDPDKFKNNELEFVYESGNQKSYSKFLRLISTPKNERNLIDFVHIQCENKSFWSNVNVNTLTVQYSDLYGHTESERFSIVQDPYQTLESVSGFRHKFYLYNETDLVLGFLPAKTTVTFVFTTAHYFKKINYFKASFFTKIKNLIVEKFKKKQY